LQALDEVVRKAKSKTQIAKEYGIPCKTLSTWLKKKDVVRKSHGNCVPAEKHSYVEAALFKK